MLDTPILHKLMQWWYIFYKNKTGNINLFEAAMLDLGSNMQPHTLTAQGQLIDR